MSKDRQAVQAILLSTQTSIGLPDQAANDSQLMPAMDYKLSHAWGAGARQQWAAQHPRTAARTQGNAASVRGRALCDYR